MGSAVSALIGVAKSLKIAAGILHDQYKQFNDLDNRFNKAPGLPRPNPTRSFWLEDPPYPELVDVQSKVLPAQADVVVIGSGITGVAVAHSLLGDKSELSSPSELPSPPPLVVVLEARQLCSGATGRNGGHIKASPHETINNLITHRGLPGDRAAALVRFQLAHLQHLVDLCNASDDGLADAAECREVETVDLFVDEGAFEEGKQMVALLYEWVPEFEMAVWTAKEAQERFSAGVDVVGAISYVAGAIWPYRFVTSLWRRLLDAHPDSLSIETGTPALDIQVDSSNSQFSGDVSVETISAAAYPYRVVTPRGVIRARHVVHATNAFMSQLLPNLRRKVAGFRGHMSAQRPGPRFPNLDGQRSWSVIFRNGFDYITQRPSREVVSSDDGKTHREPGEVMAGGGFLRSVGSGIDQMAVYDDTTTDLFTKIHLHGVLSSVFAPHWGPDGDISASQKIGSTPQVGDGHIISLWSGIIAITGDLLPFVGRLEPRLTDRQPPSHTTIRGNVDKQDTAKLPDPGEWISAAYIGDGMVWAWLSGTALGLMVAGRDRKDLPPAPGRPAGRVMDWLPRELAPSYDRMDKMDVTDLADWLM